MRGFHSHVFGKLEHVVSEVLPHEAGDKKAAKESAKQRKKTGEDPLIAKLRGMGAFPRHLCPFQSALPMAGRLLRNSDSDW